MNITHIYDFDGAHNLMIIKRMSDRSKIGNSYEI